MLHRVDVQTGAVSRIDAAGAGAQSPVLSPDGTRLVFVAYSADGYDLYSLPTAALGSESTPNLQLPTSKTIWELGIWESGVFNGAQRQQVSAATTDR